MAETKWIKDEAGSSYVIITRSYREAHELEREYIKLGLRTHVNMYNSFANTWQLTVEK